MNLVTQTMANSHSSKSLLRATSDRVWYKRSLTGGVSINLLKFVNEVRNVKKVLAVSYPKISKMFASPGLVYLNFDFREKTTTISLIYCPTMFDLSTKYIGRPSPFTEYRLKRCGHSVKSFSMESPH